MDYRFGMRDLALLLEGFNDAVVVYQGSLSGWIGK